MGVIATRAEAESYRRAWGDLPTGWTEEAAIREERRREVAAWGARHAMCFGSCRHTTNRCDGGPDDGGQSTGTESTNEG